MKSLSFPRRSFLKSVVALGGLGALVPVLARTSAWAEEKLELIDMSEKKRTDAQNKQAVALAKNFDYVEAADAKNRKGATTQKTAKGKELKPDAQFCINCTYYVKEKGKAEGAPCQIIPAGGVAVHAKGWCKMYRPRDDA